MTTTALALPLVQELVPAPSAPDAARRLLDLPGLAWLDGAADPLGAGRWSYLSADPVLRCEGATALDATRAALGAWPMARLPGLPPFQGGALGFLAYEFGRTLERIPAPRHDDLGLPLAQLGIHDWVLAWDHLEGRCWLVSSGYPEGPARAEARAAMVRARLAGAPRALPAAPPAIDRPSPPTYPVLGIADAERLALRSTFTRRGFMDAVQRVRDYIVAGDIFQANISQRFEAPLHLPPMALYQALRQRNPAAYAAYLDAGTHVVLGASPERFLRLEGRHVETRPIKGTAPRGVGPMHDLHLGQALTESAKDRAENVMIVDLLRNDLSRVCDPGTVRVPALFALESHPTVHHLVSTVTGELATGLDAFDLVRATFPGGSITGAPKVRAMEIIAELEPTARGVYCGSLGWIGFDGAMDLNIAIRTMVVAGGKVTFSAGGGMTYESDPDKEWHETIVKAAGLVAALASAVAG